MILQKKTVRTGRGTSKVELVEEGTDYIVKVDGTFIKELQMSCSQCRHLMRFRKARKNNYGRNKETGSCS